MTSKRASNFVCIPRKIYTQPTRHNKFPKESTRFISKKSQIPMKDGKYEIGGMLYNEVCFSCLFQNPTILTFPGHIPRFGSADHCPCFFGNEFTILELPTAPLEWDWILTGNLFKNTENFISNLYV